MKNFRIRLRCAFRILLGKPAAYGVTVNMRGAAFMAATPERSIAWPPGAWACCTFVCREGEGAVFEVKP